MSNTESKFDELEFFAKAKKMPGAIYGRPSLLSFRDHLFGMEYAFSFCCQESPLKYFRLFTERYHKEIIKSRNGYACWWNHILYTNGNSDESAFWDFFCIFERYLLEVHNVRLPEVAFSKYNANDVEIIMADGK